MATKNIINIIEKGDIAKDLKSAYKFMLLSRGYSAEEVQILDEYDFFVRKRECGDSSTATHIGDEPLKKRRKKSLPKTLVCLTSTSEAYNKRDHTLYSLNGKEPVTKGRLVWSIICLYQEQYKPTYEDISQLFNRKLNLLGNTVIDEASLDALRADKQKRFYYHEADLLISADGIRYAVSNQWSKDKMDEVILFAHSLGWSVEVTNPIK